MSQQSGGPEVSLRKRIASGQIVRALFTGLADPGLIEIAGLLGVDFVCLDLEHSSTSDAAAEAACRSADNVRVPIVARIRRDELARAARFLDAGGAGIIAPHVESLSDVGAICESVLLPPEGNRGAGATRSTQHGFGTIDRDWVAGHNGDFLLGVQIEDATGVLNAAQIAAHPAVAFILPGTRDLSFDLGVPGEYNHRLVRDALDSIVAASSGRCALGAVIGDLSRSRPESATVLMAGLGPLLHYSFDRLLRLE